MARNSKPAILSISTTLLWTDISRKVNFLVSNNIAIRTQNVQSMTELPNTFPLILLKKTPWVLFAIIKSNNWKEKTYRHSQGQLHNALLSLTSAVVVTNTEGDTESHQREHCQQLQLVNICTKYLSGTSGFFFFQLKNLKTTETPPLLGTVSLPTHPSWFLLKLTSMPLHGALVKRVHSKTVPWCSSPGSNN